MSNKEIVELFESLWDDLHDEDEFYNQNELLVAHYTTIQTLEKIAQSNEIWFSNPLVMNDYEEWVAGMRVGSTQFRVATILREACGSDLRYRRVQEAFEWCLNELETKGKLDTYVLCLSEHDRSDSNGLLSMWRGYGGDGNGAALVLDASRIPHAEETPFIFAKVRYITDEQRAEWIRNKIEQFAGIIRENDVADEHLFAATERFFARLNMFSLFTKHKGFEEEREWRIVYASFYDLESRLEPMFDYLVGPDGIEPKLKFALNREDPLTGQDLSLEAIVYAVILGPSVATHLAVHAVRRMLKRTNHGDLIDRIRVSRTPYRSTR